MKSSPMKIPEARGKAFRLILSVIVFSLGLSITYIVLTGIMDGEMFTKLSRYVDGVSISNASNSQGFWISTSINLILAGVCFYLSLAEIIYTINKYKRRLK